MSVHSSPRVADWDTWRNIPFPELWQAIALSLGIEPGKVEKFIVGSMGDLQFMEGPVFANRLTMAKANATVDGGLYKALYSHREVREYSQVKLPQFAAWALSLNWEMPAEMVEIAQRVPVREAFAFDPTSATYPPELDVAFTAWLAVSRKASTRKSPKKQLIEWLKEHNRSLSDEARERIATVCNWQRTGGKPRA